MIDRDFDLVIIGAGPGGYVSAIRASQLGLRTAVIERDQVGGICLNWGCIPTKSLLESANLFLKAKVANSFGIDLKDLNFTYETIVKRSRNIANRLVKGVQLLFKKNKITLIKGIGFIKNKNTIVVYKEDENLTLTSKFIIIATGCRPFELPSMKFDHKYILTSRDAMILNSLPKSITIVGGGPIGVEFAHFFNALGSKVTLIEMLNHLLPYEDGEIAKELEKSFIRRGIKILTSAKVIQADVKNQEVIVKYEKDGKINEITSEKALVAIGLIPNTQNIGLENVGIKTERGYILTDNYFQTNVKNIFAIGDCNYGFPKLAHSASHQGIIAVEKIAGLSPEPFKTELVPLCVYSEPQVASIGLNQEKAMKLGYNISIGKFPYLANGKALAQNERTGFIKIIADKEKGNILGANIIGYSATELISELTLAVKFKLKVEELLTLIHPHPTLSEIITEAIADTENRAIHK